MRKCATSAVGKIVATFIAEKAGKTVERGRIGRQRVGLLVGDHLQAMLDAAQKIVGRGQFVARGGVDPTAGGERGQRRDRAAAAQFVMAAAGDELLGLHEKFDLADAAAAELDIVALDGDLAMATIGMDLPLHLVHVGDGRVIEIFAPDERREIAQKPFAGGKIAGAGRALISAARSQFCPRLS